MLHGSVEYGLVLWLGFLARALLVQVQTFVQVDIAADVRERLLCWLQVVACYFFSGFRVKAHELVEFRVEGLGKLLLLARTYDVGLLLAAVRE